MSDPYVLKVDTTLKNGDSLTVPYTITITDSASTINVPVMKSWTTTTTSGTWTATGTLLRDIPPDMTDWPPDDIIDWYAKELAEKHPA